MAHFNFQNSYFPPQSQYTQSFVPTNPYSQQEYSLPHQEDGFRSAGSLLESGNFDDSISAVTCDPLDELIWTGTSNGRIVSYRLPDMVKYTCWRAHYDEVRTLLPNEQGLLSISTSSIRFYTREGQLQLSYAQEDLEALSCGIWTSSSQVSALIGSHIQPRLKLFDLRRGKIVKEIEMEVPTTCLKKTPKVLVCGQTDGKITVRDPRSFHLEHMFSPFTDHVATLDVKGDYLIASGFARDFRNGSPIPDQLLRVFDLRMMRIMHNIQFMEGAFFLKFHPKFSSTVVVANQPGTNVQIVDISVPRGYIHHQFDMQLNEDEALFCADFSSSGECFVAGDQLGACHVWTSSENYCINSWSKNAAYHPSPPPNPPPLSRDSLLSPSWISQLFNSSLMMARNPIHSHVHHHHHHLLQSNAAAFNNLQQGQSLNYQSLDSSPIAVIIPSKSNPAGQSNLSSQRSETSTHEGGNNPNTVITSNEVPLDPNPNPSNPSSNESFKTPTKKSQSSSSSSNPISTNISNTPKDQHSVSISANSTAMTPSGKNATLLQHLEIRADPIKDSTIGLGTRNYKEHRPLSAFLSEDMYRVSKPPEKIDPELLRTMKISAGVGIITTEPGVHRRNLASKVYLESIENNNNIGTDDNGIWKDQPGIYGTKDDDPSLLMLDDFLPPTPSHSIHSRSNSGPSKIPRQYRLMMNHQFSFSLNFESVVDYSNYNRTSHAGLESIGKVSSLSNPIIQMIYHVPQLRAFCLNHLCDSPICLTCELSFLFHMFEMQKSTSHLNRHTVFGGDNGTISPEVTTNISSSTNTCSSKNFLHTIKSHQKSNFSGLFGNESDNISVVGWPKLVDKFWRFLSTQLHEENLSLLSSSRLNLSSSLSSTLSSTTMIDSLFGFQVKAGRTCSNCRQTFGSSLKSFQTKLFLPQDFDETQSSRYSFAHMLNAALSSYSPKINAWCSHCNSFQPIVIQHQTEQLPLILTVSCDFGESNASSMFWKSVSDEINTLNLNNASNEHWLPFFITISRDPSSHSSKFIIHEYDKPPSNVSDEELYELTAVISHVFEESESHHCVSQIKIVSQSPISSNNKNQSSPGAEKWFLFNDFHVAPCSNFDAVHIQSDWKIPCLLQYTRKSLSSSLEIQKSQSPITIDSLNKIQETKFFTLDNNSSPIKSFFNPSINSDIFNKELAIDSEYVLIKEEELEENLHGNQTISPAEFGLARVSVLATLKSNNNNLTEQNQTVCIMDDYVCTNAHSIVDYLTQYSGIYPGDLDPVTSKYHVIPLKYVYLKLRYLVDCGFSLIGHGLAKDFSTINIVVPDNQVIDTVEIFKLPNQRKISLRFLASVLLNLDIQQETHDSIEDSRTALLLYRKYQQLLKEDKFKSSLEEVYKLGRKRQWK